MGPSQGWWDSDGFSGELLPVIPLNSQGKTKIKTNEKPWQILGDIRATLSTLNSLALELDDRILGKLAEASEGWEFLPESAPPDLYSAQSRDSKVKFHVVPHWLSILFSPRDSYCLLACLILWQLGLAFCQPGTGRLLVLAFADNLTIRLGAQTYGQTEVWSAPISS